MAVPPKAGAAVTEAAQDNVENNVVFALLLLCCVSSPTTKQSTSADNARNKFLEKSERARREGKGRERWGKVKEE